MGIAIAAGMPVFSGTTIPVIYPKELRVKMYKKTVATNLCSLDLQSQLKKMGDTARVRIPPVVHRKTGVGYQKMVAETPGLTYIDFTISTRIYYDLLLDNVISQQSDIDIMAAYEEAMIKDNGVQTDADIFEILDAGAAAANQGATAGIETEDYNLGATGASIAVTELNAPDVLADLLFTLKEQNVEDDDMTSLAVPQWYLRRLVTSEFKEANLTGDPSSTLRSGWKGNIFGVQLYSSNNMYKTTDATDSNVCYRALALHKAAAAFAQTITEMRVVQPTEYMAKELQLEVVYDGKVMNPDLLATAYCRPSK